MFSSTVRWGNRLKFWKTKPTCWRSWRMSPFCGPRLRPASIVTSPTRIVPLSGCSSRLMLRSRVVLPEPLGPMIATTSPFCTSRSIPWSTVWPWNFLPGFSLLSHSFRITLLAVQLVFKIILQRGEHCRHYPVDQGSRQIHSEDLQGSRGD